MLSMAGASRKARWEGLPDRDSTVGGTCFSVSSQAKAKTLEYLYFVIYVLINRFYTSA